MAEAESSGLAARDQYTGKALEARSDRQLFHGALSVPLRKSLSNLHEGRRAGYG